MSIVSSIAEEQREHYDRYHSKNWVPGLDFESPSNAYAHLKYRRIVSRWVADELRRRSEPRLAILDAGCGDGLQLLRLAANTPGSERLELHGVDISEKGIEAAWKLAAFHGFSQAKFKVGTMEALPFPDNTFDLLVSTEVLEHLSEPSRALDEFYRVLTPGGMAVIGTQNRAYLFERMADHLPGGLRGKLAGVQHDGEMGDDNWEHAHPSEMTWRELRRALLLSGFVVERVRGASLISQKGWADRHSLLMSTMLVFDAAFDLVRLGPDFQYAMLTQVRKPR